MHDLTPQVQPMNTATPAPDYRVLFESAPNAYLLVLPDDPKFTIVAANDAYLKLAKVKREDVLGRGLFEILPDDQVQSAANDGDKMHASLRPATPILNGSGMVEYLLYSITDTLDAHDQEDSTRKQLETSEKRFRQLAETTGFGLIIATFEVGVSYANATVRHLLGYSEQEVAAGLLRWNEITPPEFAAIDAQAWQEVLTTGKCTPFEKIYFSKDGRRIPVLIGASLLESANGTTEVAAFVLDLTERKQNERDAFLVRLDDATRPLIDPDEIVQKSFRMLGEYLQVDRLAYCTFEPDQETLEISWDYIQPGMPSMVGHYSLTQFGVDCARDLRANLPYRMPDVEGGALPAEVKDAFRQAGIRAHVAVPLQKAGKLVAAVGAHQRTVRTWQPEEADLISSVANRCWESLERARMQENLRESQERLSAAVTVAQLGAFEWNIVTDDVRLDDRSRSIFGIAPGKVIEAQDIFDRIDEADIDRVKNEVRANLVNKARLETEYRINLPDGTPRTILSVNDVALGANGEVERFIGVFSDITERKKAEEILRSSNDALQRANRELEEFAYVASHDLQEPLRMVNIYTQLLLRQIGGEDENLNQYAAIIRQGVTRMDALIQDLLTFSRTVHSEKLPIGTADLSNSFREALAVLKDTIDENQAIITVDRLPVVCADSPQMTHVFQNLLSNALKYRRKESPPTIYISAERSDSCWTVAVRDNGIGFHPQYAQRIFGLFKRLHKEEYPGTGLGLAICKRIIERFGGSMWAEGKPGEGATFYFSLPHAEAE